MNRLMGPGVITLALTFIEGLWMVISPFAEGLWMVISPFALQAQAVEAIWSPGTINDVAVSGVLLGVSVLDAGQTLAFGLRDLVRAASQRLEHPAASSLA